MNQTCRHQDRRQIIWLNDENCHICLQCATHLPNYASGDSEQVCCITSEFLCQCCNADSEDPLQPPASPAAAPLLEVCVFGGGAAHNGARNTSPPNKHTPPAQKLQLRPHIQQGRSHLETVTENYHFSQSIEDETKRKYDIFCNIANSGKQARSLAAVCLYHTCLCDNVSRPCKYICGLFGISTSDFWKMEKKLHAFSEYKRLDHGQSSDDNLDAVWYRNKEEFYKQGMDRYRFNRLLRVVSELQKVYCRQSETLFAAALLLWSKEQCQYYSGRKQLSARQCAQFANVSTSAVCRLVSEIQKSQLTRYSFWNIPPIDPAIYKTSKTPF